MQHIAHVGQLDQCFEVILRAELDPVVGHVELLFDPDMRVDRADAVHEPPAVRGRGAAAGEDDAL